MRLPRNLFGMTRRALSAWAALVLASAAAPLPAFAAGELAAPDGVQLQMMVDRRSYGIELYLRLGADDAVALFGLPETTLLGDDGGIAFERRRMGTAPIADQMFAPVRAVQDTSPLSFEAMSLMVHEEGDVLPFSEPIDGVVAIELCAVPTPDAPIGLSDVMLYSGFVAYTDTPSDAVHLHLPPDGPERVTVTLAAFEDGVLQVAEQIAWTKDAPLVLPATSRIGFAFAWGLAGVAALLALAAMAALMRRKPVLRTT